MEIGVRYYGRGLEKACESLQASPGFGVLNLLKELCHVSDSHD
jgi:hypothetical protein